MKNWVLKSHENQMKKNIIWNIIGSMLFALASIVLVTLVKRIIGIEAGDDFTFAYSVAQMLLTIGYFEIRPFQVTDGKGDYEFADYLSFSINNISAYVVSWYFVCSDFRFIQSKRFTDYWINHL